VIEIRTERLLLRPARSDDVEAFHRILSDPEAMAFWSTLPHADVVATRVWVADMMNIDPEQGEDFVVERNGAVIGKAGLYRFPEIGYILHPGAWGKGYALEALTPVLRRAFAVHRLPSVEADIDPRNAASLRLLTRLGFEETGRARSTWNIGGNWYDSVYMRLRNPDADAVGAFDHGGDRVI
jgi:[ribosomal protein S5]-alanine N-acetyltransferase